jgi:predicted lipoprotein with Yx(FWY)xxD motif
MKGIRGTALRVAGAGLLAATAGIHLDLYLTGYRTIPVIGWLFLLQVIAAFVLALAVLVTPGSRVALAALAGAGFAISTLGGYLLSVWVGLFGFREVRTTAGVVAGVIDVVAFGALVALAALVTLAVLGHRVPPRLRPLAGPQRLGVAITALCVVALAVLGGTVATASGGGGSATGQSALLKTARIGGATVLTNARGLTLYSFAPDTSSSSACYGSCAAYWPPVTGTPVAGAGVTGKLATIRRTDGTLQVTYDGHPLYTYIGDTGPGQASGNGLNLNGGLWHEIPAS